VKFNYIVIVHKLCFRQALHLVAGHCYSSGIMRSAHVTVAWCARRNKSVDICTGDCASSRDVRPHVAL